MIVSCGPGGSSRICRCTVAPSRSRDTGAPPRQGAELSTWSEGLDEWYFDEAGGLFLSDDARVAYLNVLEAIAATANAGKPADPLTDEDMQRLWRAGQTLRRQLAADIGTANAPHLPGRLPVVSPPATVRFADPPMTTSAD
jgi:adenine-specific DNA methylase